MNIQQTPIETLNSLFEIAKQHLQHVFLGNVSDPVKSSTYCNSCGEVLIQRNRYKTEITGISKEGTCKACGAKTGIKLQAAFP